jgi:uncharacterized membrane protein YqjE
MRPDPVVSEQPSMTSAVERMLSASQQLVVDRLELLLLEAKEALLRAVQAGIAAGVAVAAFFCGWLCINASVAASFRETFSLPGILAVLAVIDVAIAAVAIGAARRSGAPRQQHGGRA